MSSNKNTVQKAETKEPLSYTKQQKLLDLLSSFINSNGKIDGTVYDVKELSAINKNELIDMLTIYTKTGNYTINPKNMNLEFLTDPIDVHNIPHSEFCISNQIKNETNNIATISMPPETIDGANAVIISSYDEISSKLLNNESKIDIEDNIKLEFMESTIFDLKQYCNKTKEQIKKMLKTYNYAKKCKIEIRNAAIRIKERKPVKSTLMKGETNDDISDYEDDSDGDSDSDVELEDEFNQISDDEFEENDDIVIGAKNNEKAYDDNESNKVSYAKTRSIIYIDSESTLNEIVTANIKVLESSTNIIYFFLNIGNIGNVTHGLYKYTGDSNIYCFPHIIKNNKKYTKTSAYVFCLESEVINKYPEYVKNVPNWAKNHFRNHGYSNFYFMLNDKCEKYISELVAQ